MAAKKLFEWECKNGTAIKLPSLDTLDPDLSASERIADAAAGGNDLITIGAHVKFLKSGLPAEYHAAFDQLKSSEFDAFMKAWAEWSGVESGE